MSDPIPEPDPTLSLDATFSTYEPAPEPKEAEYPPSGPATVQTLGRPSEGVKQEGMTKLGDSKKSTRSSG